MRTIDQAECGDIVQLKSGGPHMTVGQTGVATTHGRGLVCVWHSNDGVMQSATVVTGCLRFATPLSSD